MQIFLVIASFIASINLALGAIYAAIRMHNLLLSYVIHWPNELFDTTPLGRILNR